MHEGFTMVPDWLIDDSDLDLPALAVVLVLLRHTDRATGTCYPSLTTIADRARISRETVKRVLPILEARGVVQIERRRVGSKNLPNVYRLTLTAPATSAKGTRIPRRGVGTRSAQAGSVSAHGGHSECPEPDTENQTQEPESRVRRFASHADDEIDIEAVEIDQRSRAQIALLSDLHILSGHGIPSEQQIARFGALSRDEYDDVKRTYWQRLDEGGRGTGYAGPGWGDAEYEHLSERGKQWADVGCMPDEMSA